MFLFLSKFLPVLLFPTGLVGIFLLLATRVRSQKWRSRLVAGAALLIWFFGNSWVSNFLVRTLEWRYLPRETYPAAEAIVILGGGTAPIEYPRQTVEVNAAGDRVLYGAALYRAGLAPIVVVTGGNLPWTDTYRNPAEDMRDLLVSLGVPEDAILVEGESDNTYENAALTRELLEPMGVHKILLVTSAMHMPRSVPLFENQGFFTIPAPTDYNTTRPAGQRPLSETWPDYLFSIFPNASALSDSSLALKEYIGITVYWLRGWL